MSQKTIPFILADIGEGITECEIIQWFVKPGDKVAQFDKICEVQSDKAAVEITSRYDGVIQTIHYDVSDVAKVGSPLVDIQTDEAQSEETAASPQETPEPVSLPQSQPSPIKQSVEDSQILTTPAVRRIAKENDVDLRKVVATGKDGRILKEDVLAYLKSKDVHQIIPQPEKSITSPELPQDSSSRISLSPIQRAMFKRMTESLQIPHFLYSEEFEMTQCLALKEEFSQSFEKMSFMPILVKILSLTLMDFPVLNSKVIYEQDTPILEYRHYHNIGIAMDTPAGLIVPNVKNVQDKSILEIAKDLRRLQEAGKNNAISPSDLKEGTITLSNIGPIGGLFLNPVIVSSEVCIGALGRIQRLPRYRHVQENGSAKEVLLPTPILNVSWSADHRIIDGATIARFTQKMKAYVENPAVLIGKLR